MADFFMGQIMMTGFGYAPKYFASCNGGLVGIAQNQALFSLLGITYGGDGIQTFGLPDLRGRSPAGAVVSQNAGWQPTPYFWGQIGGVETVSLTGDQNGPPTHGMTATTEQAGNYYLKGSEVFAAVTSPGALYGNSQPFIPLGGGPTTIAGAGAPHDNVQPFQAINFNIAMTGTYPSRG